MAQTLVGVFDSKRDKELIAAGTHFWCEGCLIARPLDTRSPDPRYCQGCYDFLSEEASHLSRKPSWTPKAQNKAQSQCPTAYHGAPATPPPESYLGAAGGKVGEQ